MYIQASTEERITRHKIKADVFPKRDQACDNPTQDARTSPHPIPQVVEFANRLKGEDGKPLVASARISSSTPPPAALPHIVVSTPASLIHATRDFPDAYGSFWTRGSIVSRLVSYLKCLYVS